MLMPASAIEIYIRAKDQNHPNLIASAFDPAAVVRIEAQTEAISFPPMLSGVALIEQVLVKDFALAWQEVRTFCFSHPGDDFRADFSCRWMVVMHSRHGDGARVGYGTYDWVFSGEDGQVTALKIRIDEMMVIDERQASTLTTWAASLPYPWCTDEALAEQPVPNDAVAEALKGLRTGA